MEENVFWELFLDTGSPEAYLLFKKSRRDTHPAEGEHSRI